MSEFDKKREGTGTKEWAETTFNIGNGCANGCLYCYACANALRFKLKDGRDSWTVEELTRNAEIPSFPAKRGTIMFPSSHDITPFYLARYIRVALMMLQKGNHLLITTKASYAVMDAMLGAFKGYEQQILFRVTIGSMKEPVTSFWEPGAPTPSDRLRALYLAYACGFQTSVSIEPMLGGYLSTLEVVNRVMPFTTETIWIGKMNKIRLRVDMRDPEVQRWVERIEHMQGDAEICMLHRDLKDNPQVRWKDSIRQVLALMGITPEEAP